MEMALAIVISSHFLIGILWYVAGYRDGKSRIPAAVIIEDMGDDNEDQYT